MKPRSLFRLLTLYPPYLGAGIQITRVNAEVSEIDVRMKVRPWNRNYVRTAFGGSLYSMCDPFYMLILMTQLGRDYIVWDKAATIRFKKPGRGTVRASFAISPEKVAEIRAAADASPKVEPTFTVSVLDEAGEVVAEVDKLLYVKRKDRSK